MADAQGADLGAARLGKQPGDSPSPTTRGLAKEADSLLHKSHETLVDEVAVSGGLATEHYEIATYTTLIDMAQGRGATEVARLLQANLDQEVHTSEELQTMLQKIAG